MRVLISGLKTKFERVTKKLEYHSGVDGFVNDFKLQSSYEILINKELFNSIDQDPLVYVAETVQHFITLMDQLKLNMFDIDQLLPTLSDLVHSAEKCPNFNKDSTTKGKVQPWFEKLSNMKANDTLSEEDARQFLFDLDCAYQVFYRTLKK